MKKLFAVLVAALLLGMAVNADAQSTIRMYTQPVVIHAGADSFYVGHGAAVGTDSTTFEISFTAGVHSDTETTNWLDISDLWVPPFYESYCDTSFSVSGIREMKETGGAVAIDSLAYASNTSVHSWPIGMRIAAAVSNKATTTDSVKISVQVSMNKLGYHVVWADFIEPSYLSATTPELLADASATKRVMSIPAGKLYGWKYMRLAVTGDNDHEAGLACKLYHYYRTYQGMPGYKVPY